MRLDLSWRLEVVGQQQMLSQTLIASIGDVASDSELIQERFCVARLLKVKRRLSLEVVDLHQIEQTSQCLQRLLDLLATSRGQQLGRLVERMFQVHDEPLLPAKMEPKKLVSKRVPERPQIVAERRDVLGTSLSAVSVSATRQSRTMVPYFGLRAVDRAR